ncbi:MAG: helix-turn-helix domain-containing protein [Planctomycetaceae bacterium]|nr:helix-turn-helix domain-containing protein [Planctomycetaceae bacterium]
MSNLLSCPVSTPLTPEVSRRPSLLPASEVAKVLAISIRTLWRLESAGKLPLAVRIGSSKRWRQDELDAWIEAGCPPRVPAPRRR